MISTSRFLAAALGAVLIAGFTFEGTADARQLRYATPWPPGSISADAADEYASAVEEFSNGTLNVKVYPLTLLSAAESSAGTRDGITDIGYIFAGYYPAEYPHINFLAETSMQLQLFDPEQVDGIKGTAAFSGAISEFIAFRCPECLEEFSKQNQVYTSNGSTSGYGLLCNKEISTFNDLKGKRLRVAGSNWSRWSSQAGASSVSITVNDLMEGLSQGIIDCSVSAAAELINLRLIDVVTDITMGVPGGIFSGVAPTNINADVWKSLSSDERQALLRAGAVMTAQGPWHYIRLEEAALEQARKKGAKLHKPSAELIEKTRQFAMEDLKTIKAYYEKNHGIKNTEIMLDDFREVLDRWIGLVQNVESIDQLTDLYWNEIFSKIDVQKHGM